MVNPYITEDGHTVFVTGHQFLNWVKEKYGFDDAFYVAQHFDWLRMSEANNRPELQEKAISGLEAIGLGVIIV
jgi:hypothetical protein